VITEIISQHVEEASFLWFLRANALRAPHYALKDLAKLDDRVGAHIDGVRIAGPVGWDLCKDALGLGGPGEIFAAAVLAFESGDALQIADVVAHVMDSGEFACGIVSALGWIPFTQAQPHLDRFLVSDVPNLRRIGTAGYAVHRHDPGAPLKKVLTDVDVPLKTRALKAVGELGCLELLPAVLAHLSSDDPEVQFRAAWSASLLRSLAGVPVLRTLAEGAGPYAERAAAMALRWMGLDDAHAWQRELAGRPQFRRLSVQAAGVMGDPALIPWLIEKMAISPVARVAGEAFTFITGVDLALHDLEGEWPEGFQAGPTEDPNDDNVDMDPDEDLPWPNQELIDKWWKAHEAEYKKGTRYLCGKPINGESLQYVMRHSKQRQREAAAIELPMLHPGTPLFNVKAPGFRQMEQLSKIR
jgi:uncharacterized protein (TIGR02270 family)